MPKQPNAKQAVKVAPLPIVDNEMPRPKDTEKLLGGRPPRGQACYDDRDCGTNYIGRR